MLEIGVDRLIVGTAAIKNIDFLNQIKKENISDQIIFGLDFVSTKNEPMLFVNVWTENTRINIVSPNHQSSCQAWLLYLVAYQ